MKKLALFLYILAASLSISTLAWGADPVLLPKAFGGWEKVKSNVSKDSNVAEPALPGIMKEFGFSDFETASYERPGRKMTVKAARFADASGAYGAFTYYKVPEMLNEKIGDQGASWNERILFYRGNVLVQATLDRLTAMSAAELRELAESIPLPAGPSRNPPTLPQYLPRQSYIKNSAKYVLGPAGLNAIGAPLPAEQIDFSRSPEVVLGKYSTSSGTATLLLVGYPTPAIAGDRLRAFEALNQNSTPQQDQTLAGPFTVKRTGPIVVLVAGQIPASEAKSLLASINYDAEITWNERTNSDPKENVGSLLVNIIMLCFILIGFALVIGLAFGGIRILNQRFLPGRMFDRPDKMEIIELKLGK